MVKKSRLNKRRLAIAIILLIAIIAFFTCFIMKKPFEKKVKKEVKVEEKIDDYGYELENNETSYYKSLFKNLKNILKEKEVDEEKYASLVGQLFLTDFFTLDNKLNKNDVGGIQFIYRDFQNDFVNFAKAEVYRYVENNIYGDRNQSLPVVKEVSVLNMEQMSFDYLEKNDEKAYQIDFKISYEEDLGYQDVATLVLVHNEERLEIIKMTE